jgi:Domain of unknown function (DUF4062)
LPERESDAVVLLLGESYGSIQVSGKSPTHEELEEAIYGIRRFVEAGRLRRNKVGAAVIVVNPDTSRVACALIRMTAMAMVSLIKIRTMNVNARRAVALVCT